MPVQKQEVCDRLKRIIESHRFSIVHTTEDKQKCTIDFKHPLMPRALPAGWFLSGVEYDKSGRIETTIRLPITKYKEVLGFDCCEDGQHVCSFHVAPKQKGEEIPATFSAKATWRSKDEDVLIDKFLGLLLEMS